MYNTYQMMLQVANCVSNQVTESNDELVILYQGTKDEYYIARFFVKNFAFLLQIGASFPLVLMEDKASLATTCCERTLRKFNHEKSGSPLTYLGSIYKNDLISAFNYMEKGGRFSDHPNNVLPWINENEVEEGSGISSTEAHMERLGRGPDYNLRTFAEVEFAVDFANMLENFPFKPDEEIFLRGKYADKTVKEIAGQIGVSNSQVNQIQTRIQTHLNKALRCQLN